MLSLSIVSSRKNLPLWNDLSCTCFTETSATNALSLGKKRKRKKGKIYFKNTALEIRIWTLILLKCIRGDLKE